MIRHDPTTCPQGQRRWKWSPWASAQSPPLPLRRPRGLDPFSLTSETSLTEPRGQSHAAADR
jgi:hypothetical protein